MYVIITSPVSGNDGTLVAPFVSKRAAGEYLEQKGWHKSIGNWWSNGNMRAMIWPEAEPPPGWKKVCPIRPRMRVAS